MEKIRLCLVGLILVLGFTQVVETVPQLSSYNPVADVNRDGIIDVFDLIKVAIAFGSTQTLPTQSNQTVVYVYQIETEPPEVQNARVAIIDPDCYYQAVHVGYTNSSGLVNFTLNPNSNYTAIAWSKTTYNYANFTTNHYGEATVIVQLGYPNLPPHWVAITMINRTSGELGLNPDLGAVVEELVYNYPGNNFTGVALASIILVPFKGVFIVGPWAPAVPMTEPGKSYAVILFIPAGPVATPVYTPDENGNANVITYV